MSMITPLRSPVEQKRAKLATLMRESAANRVHQVPVSHGQKALWFLHQSAAGSPAYNVGFAVRILSSLDSDALHKTFQRLVDRHASLRSHFRMDDGELAQVIAGHETVSFEHTTVPGCQEAELGEIVQSAYRQPFDLEHGPLFRVALFTVAPEQHVLLLTISHIVHDGWSLWTLLDEAGKMYAAEANGDKLILPPLAASYQDFVEQQGRFLAGPRGDASWTFWKRQLAGELPMLELPRDRMRPPVQTFNGDSHAFHLPSSLSQSLRRLARQQGVTPFILLLAAYKVLLSRYAGQQDILVGTPTAGPRDGAFSEVIGYFVNPIVIRSNLAGNPPFTEFLRTVGDHVLEALEHQDFPFPLLVERLRLRRDPSCSPIFQASFVLQQSRREGVLLDLGGGDVSQVQGQWGGLPVGPYDLPQQEGQFDIELELLAAQDELSGSIKYNQDLFDPSSMQRMADSFLVLLGAIVQSPDTPIEQLAILSSEARQLLLAASGSGSQRRFEVACLHTSFEARASETPRAIAVVDGDHKLSYAELNRHADALASRLLALGVSPGTLVGLCLQPCADLLIGILAILKAGGAYVPLDPNTPLDRRRFIIQDSAVRIVITQSALITELAESELQLISVDGAWKDKPAHVPAKAFAGHQAPPVDRLAYVIYTSGTTGRPKGVRVAHQHVARLFSATRAWYGFDASDVWPLFHSSAFDVSVWEMWGALLHGGQLVIVPTLTARDPQAFHTLLCDAGVTVLNQTPSAFRQLMAAQGRQPRAHRLRTVIFAGEALDPTMLKPWFKQEVNRPTRLVNMYGITETTVHATYRPIEPADADKSGASPIGEPIPDLSLYLLDAHLQPVPAGVTGEIFVGGDGVTAGYLNRPELDQARFIPDPFCGESTARLYRSGDMARRLQNGELEYLGRADTQVKIRGFRIELGEIEAVLGEHPEVAAAIVRVQRNAETGDRLVAYVVPRSATPPPSSEWRGHLAQRLPDYMVPSVFVPIASVPLTGNGKLDHAALPSPDVGRSLDHVRLVPPRDAVERTLCRLWARALKMETIGVQDNFFELGGHSILAAHLMAQIEQEFGRKLPLAALFRYPTIETLGACLRESEAELPWSPLVPIRQAGNRSPFFCVAGGGGNVLYFYALASHAAIDRPFHGLQAIGLDGVQAPMESVEAIATRYVDEIRRVQPQGPYLLGGHCFGSWIAFEMAQQLRRQGHVVERVIVMDAPAPLPRSAQLVSEGPQDDAAWLALFATVLAESAGKDLGITEEALRSLTTEEQLLHFKERMEAAGLLPPGTALAQVRGFFQVFVQNSRTRYEPKDIVQVPIALFRAGEYHPDYDYAECETPGQTALASSLGWDVFGGDDVTVDVVPGNHITMMSDPNVSTLAQALERRLR